MDGKGWLLAGRVSLSALSVVVLAVLVMCGFAHVTPDGHLAMADDVRYAPALLVFSMSCVLADRRRWLLVAGFVLTLVQMGLVSLLRGIIVPQFWYIAVITVPWFGWNLRSIRRRRKTMDGTEA